MSNIDAVVMAEDEDTGKKGKPVKLIALLLVAALAGVAGWWFMLRPVAAEEAPHPGEVVKLDAIQVNLEGGHYLRIGIALQATDEVEEELDGSKALDATIELFTGRTMEQLRSEKYRHRLKTKLEAHLDEAYEGEVMGVYFTDFVTQ
jgi:flagellar FliL protein